MKTGIVVLTNADRTTFRIGSESDVYNALDIDSGNITPAMGFPKKYWYEDCIILVMP